MLLRKITIFFNLLLWSLLTIVLHTPKVSATTCGLPPNLASELVGDPPPGSCCQEHVCNIPCPIPVDDPGIGFGIAVLVFIVLSVIVGVAAYFIVRNEAFKFFVAGRSLSLPIIAISLASQSIGGNALFGNVNMSYEHHFWDGAVIPIGLALSLLLNAIFFAAPIHRERILTLPDLFAKRYGVTVELLMSLATSLSFLFQLAGNLLYMGIILSYLLGISQTAATWLAVAMVWLYAVCGGLISVTYTDVLQSAIGWIGCLACTFWFIRNSDPAAPPPSQGMDSYIYPTDEICQLYSGVTCYFNSSGCCYNGILPIDNAAYPLGDQREYSDQMTSHLSLSPYPNAIFWNWATLFILCFGNLGALDSQARCMSSRSPISSSISCVIAAVLTIVVGVPLSYLGAIVRVFYGPDSIHAQFDPNTCSTLLGRATCAEWRHDDNAFLKLLTHEAPKFLGGWFLIGLIGAAMSTADGAILALGSVFSHNILRHIARLFRQPFSDTILLQLARLSTLLYAIAGTFLAIYGPSTTNLLVVAFDVVLATIIPALFGAIYASKPSPAAALLSFATGAVVRIVLQWTLPKDGSFFLPFKDPEFLDYGPAASLKAPTFFDGNSSTVWNPALETCEQSRFKDFTGVDSLVSLVASALVFVIVQAIESCLKKRLFRFPGDVGYVKDTCDCLNGELEDDERSSTKL